MIRIVHLKKQLCNSIIQNYFKASLLYVIRSTKDSMENKNVKNCFIAYDGISR